MKKEMVIHTREWEAWETQLGSVPVECVAHEDFSSYSGRCDASIYRLENGEYALVVQEGCSCYESSQADIEKFPSIGPASEKLEQWKKENKGD